MAAPADVDVTDWIEKAANEFLVKKLDGVTRVPYERARKAACIHTHDYITPYVADLADVVDLEAVRAAGVRIGINPLGGAAVEYWQPIIERYKIAATVVNDDIDPTFRFMTVDWDGKVRMDCSSPYAMTRLIVTELVINALKHAFVDDRLDGMIIVAYSTTEANWRLSVSDNGIGDSKGHRDEIVPGLGTILVERLANQLDGHVANSMTSHGTTVSIIHEPCRPQLSAALGHALAPLT